MSKSPGERAPVRSFWWWKRPRSAFLDIGLAVLAALECALTTVSFLSARVHLNSAGATGVALLGAVAGGSLVLRRRWPAVPVLVTLVAMPGMLGVLLLVVSLYTLAETWEWPSRRWRVMALSGLAFAEAVAVMMVSMLTPGDSVVVEQPPLWGQVLIAVLVAVGLTVPPVVTGLYVGARRRLIDSLKDRAHGLETELDLLAEQAQERARRARLEERTRIAREMHDVVAHRVSLMVVHAGALERIAAKDPEKATQSAKLMGEVGRQALNELREILGVLRMDDERQPQPDSLAGLPRLVDQSRAAGMAVTLTVSGSRQEFTGEAERTAYRVVQEGLTNAHKYAGGAQVSVLLAYAPNGVRVSVVNACPGGGGGAAKLPSGGNGLVGMRERVIALGGTFSSGPEADGGFRVEAVLPSRLAVRAEPLR
ncbi:signal transduction histidine kinase [Kitasatospora sp. MAA19]|uniref:sensor histidine kinase n=1 Tax=Kitasatospora sp. MAA19 TaxID=3035090 RepID=UPI0024766F2D|nr:histidine kinase [Kitasatospora sp. MAA19]MDH6706259.1 signal transduction histidine kinase [Kitasatospora sp. MAA19]